MKIEKITDKKFVETLIFSDAVFNGQHIVQHSIQKNVPLNIQIVSHKIGYLYKQGDVVYYVNDVVWREFDPVLANLLLSGLSLDEAMKVMMV